MMRSIQSRLLAGTVLAGIIILAGSGVSLYFLVKSSLVREFDRSLDTKTRLLASFVEEENGKIEFEVENAPEFRSGPGCEYFEIASTSGKILRRSASLSHTDLSSVVGATILPDGRPGRLASLTFQPRRADEDEDSPAQIVRTTKPVILVIARDTLDINRTMSHLLILLIVVGITGSFLSSAILALIVRSGLHPMRTLAAKIGTMGATDLSARVELPGAPAELLPVIERLNDLLNRLGAAFAREKAFSADIAHELRTPLAGLRSTLEVALSRPREPDAYRSTMTNSLTIIHQMQRMADTLLSLARAESGHADIRIEPIDLALLLREAWEPMASRAADRQLRVIWDVQACHIETDHDKLRQVITNLFDNAIAYADASGEIVIRTSCSASLARFSISNTGCTLTPEHMGHVFERFWRADPARQNTGLHSGLGLPLCRKILSLLKSDIEAECAGGIFKIVVSFGSSN